MVDEGLAQLSNNLTYSAIAVYALALVLYAAELAFGARGVVARTAHAAAQPVVGAGRPSVATRRWRPRTSRQSMGRRSAGPQCRRPDRSRIRFAARGGGDARPRRAPGAVGKHVRVLVDRGVARHWCLPRLTRQDVRFAGFFVMAPVVLTLGSRSRCSTPTRRHSYRR